MKIVVTGGAGYIGSHTLVSLAAAGHEPFVIDTFINSSPDVLDRVASITGLNIPFLNIDVRDTTSLSSCFERFRPDAVIHFAGLKSVGDSVLNPVDYYDVNFAGTLSVVRAMAVSSCKKIVFSSSATVYGVPKYLPLDEDHGLSPESPYGRSKMMVEHLLRDISFSDPDFASAILRYFNPVGAHESGIIGESASGVPANLCPFIADVASGDRPEVGVFGGDWDTVDGTGVRDYIHVMDLAEAHVSALEWCNWSSSHRAGVREFNIGTGYGISVMQMIAAFERISGRNIPFKIGPRRAGDVASYFADPSRALRELGWFPDRSIDQMVSDAWRWKMASKIGNFTTFPSNKPDSLEN